MQKPIETGKFIPKVIPRSLRKRAFRGSEIYDNFDLSKINFPDNRNTSKSRKALCAKILNSCFDLIIEDIIENNIIFTLPVSKKTPALISIRIITGDDFKKMYVKDLFPGLDFLKTDFTAPIITYTYWDKRGKQDRNVWLKSVSAWTRLCTNYSNGYSSNTIKEVDEYLDPLQKIYPYMSKTDLKLILLEK